MKKISSKLHKTKSANAGVCSSAATSSGGNSIYESDCEIKVFTCSSAVPGTSTASGISKTPNPVTFERDLFSGAPQTSLSNGNSTATISTAAATAASSSCSIKLGNSMKNWFQRAHHHHPAQKKKCAHFSSEGGERFDAKNLLEHEVSTSRDGRHSAPLRQHLGIGPPPYVTQQTPVHTSSTNTNSNHHRPRIFSSFKQFLRKNSTAATLKISKTSEISTEDDSSPYHHHQQHTQQQQSQQKDCQSRVCDIASEFRSICHDREDGDVERPPPRSSSPPLLASLSSSHKELPSSPPPPPPPLIPRDPANLKSSKTAASLSVATTNTSSRISPLPSRFAPQNIHSSLKNIIIKEDYEDPAPFDRTSLLRDFSAAQTANIDNIDNQRKHRKHQQNGFAKEMKRQSKPNQSDRKEKRQSWAHNIAEQFDHEQQKQQRQQQHSSSTSSYEEPSDQMLRKLIILERENSTQSLSIKVSK